MGSQSISHSEMLYSRSKQIKQRIKKLRITQDINEAKKYTF